jgi:hypothetical protein
MDGSSVDAKAQLPVLIKEWMTTEDEIRSLSAAVREKRKRSKMVKSMIMTIMSGSKIGQLNFSAGSVIKQTKSSKAPLTKKYLTESLTEFFKGDIDMANKCAAFIDEHRPMKSTDNLTLQPNIGMSP